MAKQRRAKTRPGVRSKSPAASIQVSPPLARPESRSAPAAPEKPQVRPTYLEAVALYEQGVSALQEHDYSRASAVLRSVLTRYPEEKDLHERVRLYVSVCERHMAPRAVSPSTPEERVF